MEKKRAKRKEKKRQKSIEIIGCKSAIKIKDKLKLVGIDKQSLR